MKKKKKIKDPYESVNKRLDALIRVTIETLDDKKFKEGDVVRILNSAGLTPTEIANILGKKGPTAVAPYLYSRGRSNKKGKKLSDDLDDKQRPDQSNS